MLYVTEAFLKIVLLKTPYTVTLKFNKPVTIILSQDWMDDGQIFHHGTAIILNVFFYFYQIISYFL